MTTKRCTICGRRLQLDAFYGAAGGRTRGACKACHRARQKRYDDAHRERKRKHDRAYARRPDVRRRRNERRRERRAKKRYVTVRFCGRNFFRHRLVVLAHRGLRWRNEVIHHVDGNPQSNQIQNLMVFRNHAEHKSYEAGNDVEAVWCGDRCQCPRCRSKSERRKETT